MRVFFRCATFSMMLSAATGFAQEASRAPQGAQQAAATPEAQAPAPQPFPDGGRYAVVNVPRIAAESAEGRAATAKVQALNQQRLNELNEKNKALQASQQKLEGGASVLSATAAAQLQKEIERQQVDIQRFTEDAQKDIQNLQAQLQEEFERRLAPVIEQLAAEKGLHLLFSATESGIIWGMPSLDLTPEIIAKLNTGASAAAASPPAARAPAPQSPAAR